MIKTLHKNEIHKKNIQNSHYQNIRELEYCNFKTTVIGTETAEGNLENKSTDSEETFFCWHDCELLVKHLGLGCS